MYVQKLLVCFTETDAYVCNNLLQDSENTAILPRNGKII